MSQEDRKNDATDALEALEEAKEAYDRFQEAWGNVGDMVRHLDYHQWNRVDAYPGWNGTRDVGAGSDMESWMKEVQETLEEERMWEFWPLSDPEKFEVHELASGQVVVVAKRDRVSDDYAPEEFGGEVEPDSLTCQACGYTSSDEGPTSQDNAHDNLCCGRSDGTCGDYKEPNYQYCATHDTMPAPAAFE